MLKLAFSGKSGYGKDTCADIVCKDRIAVKVRFAQPIYDVVEHLQATLGVPIEKDRALLRWIGGDFLREHYGDDKVWFDIQARKIDAILEESQSGIVIPDLRLPYEYDFLRDRGFTIIKVVRDFYEENHEDPIENMLDNYEFDYVIHNESIEDLHEQLSTICNKS